MGRMPRQKPGMSEQTVCTPAVFLDAVKGLVGVDEFYRDLSASHTNAVADVYYTKDEDGLQCPWKTPPDQWNWLNPEYAHIAPWVQRAWEERPRANTAVLIPASVGSNWWDEWVHDKAMVLFLKGRITFNDKHGRPICSPKTGKPTPYPKDLALLLYARDWAPGYLPWAWK